MRPSSFLHCRLRVSIVWVKSENSKVVMLNLLVSESIRVTNGFSISATFSFIAAEKIDRVFFKRPTLTRRSSFSNGGGNAATAGCSSGGGGVLLAFIRL